MACSPGVTDDCFSLREVSGTHLICPYIKEAKGRPKHDPVPGSTPNEPCVVDSPSSHRIKMQYAETKKAAQGGFSFTPQHPKCCETCNWCGRRDSNSHTLRRWNLNPVCLPIPPHPRFEALKAKAPDYESGAFSNMGWTKGIEPSTTGVTIPCSTN